MVKRRSNKSKSHQDSRNIKSILRKYWFLMVIIFLIILIFLISNLFINPANESQITRGWYHTTVPNPGGGFFGIPVVNALTDREKDILFTSETPNIDNPLVGSYIIICLQGVFFFDNTILNTQYQIIIVFWVTPNVHITIKSNLIFNSSIIIVFPPSTIEYWYTFTYNSNITTVPEPYIYINAYKSGSLYKLKIDQVFLGRI